MICTVINRKENIMFYVSMIALHEEGKSTEWATVIVHAHKYVYLSRPNTWAVREDSRLNFTTEKNDQHFWLTVKKGKKTP
jgi:hypothetical protein